MKTIAPYDVGLDKLDVSDGRHISCRITNSLLKYVKSLGYNTDSLVEDLPYSEQYLTDPFNWVPFIIKEQITDRAASLLNDEQVMYKVALATPILNSISGIENIVRGIGNPALVYRSLPKISKLFDNLNRFETKIVDDGNAIVTLSVSEGRSNSKHVCNYTRGMLAVVPTLWGLPPATVTETQCMCENDDYNAPQNLKPRVDKCVFEISWQPLKPLHTRLSERLWGDKINNSSAKKLEKNFKILDRKNAELTKRNAQLAKVREIALAVDTLKTQEQVFNTIVEKARDIPGVRFVILTKYDESGENMEVPYYSRIRNKPVQLALKAIGFDFTAATGEKPDNRKFEFAISQSEFAQRFYRNPRILVNASLAELMKGIWPDDICNTIQKMAAVNIVTVVPLTFDGVKWGSIVFCLNDEVSQDIMEMVAAHCVTAMKNVNTVNELERHNRELTALNIISNETARSLDINCILTNVINETVKIFAAQSGMIYFLDEKQRGLKLVAHTGLPEIMVREYGILSLEDSLLGKYFTSDKANITGDLKQYRLEYPDCDSIFPEVSYLPFASSKLHSKQVHTGIISIIRKNGKPFTSYELTLLQAIANQVSLAVENANLHKDLMQRMMESEKARQELECAISDLTESDRKYRLITDNTVDYIAMLDLKGNYTYISPSHTCLGYQVTDLLGKSGLALIHPDDRKQLIPLFTYYTGLKFKELLGLKKESYSKIISFKFPDKWGNWHYFEANANLTDALDGNGLNVLLISRDVTERKKAEEQIELRSRLLDKATDSIMLTAIDGKLLYVNEMTCISLGYTREELLNLTVQQLIPPESLKLLDPFLEHTIQYGKTLFEDLRLRKDGTQFPIEVYASVVDFQGQKAILSVTRDITERKQADERLKESEEYARTLSNSLGFGLLVVDAETREIVDANPAAIKQTGFDKGQILGHTCHQFICPASEGECPVLDLGQTFDVAERVLLTAAGKQLPVLKSVVPIKRHGRKYLLESFVDISLQKQMEAKLSEQKGLIERILIAAPNAVLVIGKDFRVKLGNQTFYNTFKIGSPVDGKHLDDILNNTPELSQAIATVLAGKHSRQKVDFRYEVEGKTRIMVADIIEMKEKEEVLAVIDDITEENTRQAKISLNERLISIGEMSSGIAHELNNPLTSVIGLSQLLLNENVSEEVKEDLEAIYSESCRAAAIVKNLLTFARKRTSEKRLIQINNILNDVLKLRAYEHKVNNIRVITQLDPQLPPIMADNFQMQQIFLNLILNAEQAMGESHHRGTLTVATTIVNGSIKASVTDDGPGISPENMVKLFTPFFTTKDVGKGTGLGLSICYGIVNAHGGRIYASSELGQGATFTVELPVKSYREG